MIRIEISEETETRDGMVYVLEEVARQMNQGITSGIEPSWSLEGEEEEQHEDES